MTIKARKYRYVLLGKGTRQTHLPTGDTAQVAIIQRIDIKNYYN